MLVVEEVAESKIEKKEKERTKETRKQKFAICPALRPSIVARLAVILWSLSSWWKKRELYN
jgi:hypothetical protein